MKNLVTYVFCTLVLLTFVFTGCENPKESTTFESLDDLVEALRPKTNFVSQKDFSLILESSDRFNLIDCRESEQYDSACIPKAVNLCRGVVEFEIGNSIQNRHIPTYVYSDNEEKSILVSETLKKLKFFNVIVLQGNWRQWCEAYPKHIQLEPNANKKPSAAKHVETEGGCGG